MIKPPIQRGIPAPSTIGRRQLIDYPFGEMQIGECFTVHPADSRRGDSPVFTRAQIAAVERLRYAAKRAVSRWLKQNPGFDFTVQSGQEDGRLIVRCWRIQ